jgi:hypothetical protein
MKNQVCPFCEKNKVTLSCGICTSPLCKNCTHFLEADSFSFLPKIPAELSHSAYCGNCFEEKVSSSLQAYQDTMEKARNISVFMKKQGKETRLIRRIEATVRVEKCADYDEALLRLAFFAAQGNHNALVDVDLISQKVRMGSYQSLIWSGSAVPADVQAHQILQDRSFSQNPN